MFEKIDNIEVKYKCVSKLKREKNPNKMKKYLIFLGIFAIVNSLFADSFSEIKKIDSSEQKSHKTITVKKRPLQPNEPIPQSVLKKIKKLKPIQKKHYKSLKKVYKTHIHKPYDKVEQKYYHFKNPKFYCYKISPKYIYRGLWIRWIVDLPDGYVFYQGYPYYVFNHCLHRYSDDPGNYELVDSYTYETYATFYGSNLKESYDRAAFVRDLLNNQLGEFRYFVAERFVYDPEYHYGWNPNDYPDWLWF